MHYALKKREARRPVTPSPKEDIMGLFDSLKNMFAHHEHHHGASIGQPLTLADAKVLLAFIVVHQHLGICARWPRRSNSCRTRCRNLSRLALSLIHI